MCQSVRDKASLAELAVVGSHPDRVRVRLDTKEAKGDQKGRGRDFWADVRSGGDVCCKWGGNS